MPPKSEQSTTVNKPNSIVVLCGAILSVKNPIVQQQQWVVGTPPSLGPGSDNSLA